MGQNDYTDLTLFYQKHDSAFRNENVIMLHGHKSKRSHMNGYKGGKNGRNCVKKCL